MDEGYAWELTVKPFGTHIVKTNFLGYEMPFPVRTTEGVWTLWFAAKSVNLDTRTIAGELMRVEREA